MATSVQSTPTWLYAGMSAQQFQAASMKHIQTHHARKNLWYIEIEDPNPPMGDGNSRMVNQFAVDVSYTPWTIQGDAVSVGSAQIDAISASERTEIKLTTFDSAGGKIGKWFEGKCAQIANADGSFGVMNDYKLYLRIRRMAVGRDGWVHTYTDGVTENKEGWDDQFMVRATSMERELSRRESALSELQLTFTQLDTFILPT
jgi:hypothetical protein